MLLEQYITCHVVFISIPHAHILFGILKLTYFF